VGDRLRPVWDFDDVDGSYARFRELLAEQTSDAATAEVLTQLARAEGLQGRFEAGERLVDEAEALAGAAGAARVRVLLERGRLRRSAGEQAAALDLFEAAFAAADAAGEEFLAADAAHMAALASPDLAGTVAWSSRGIEIGESSDDAEVRYWLGPLFNNLGWAHYDAGEHELALAAFERALDARARDPARPAELEIARYAVGKCLRALGRPAEAATLVEQAVAWTRSVGRPDGWFHEELAEDYAAVGRDSDAREQARLALPLLLRDDPSLAEDPARLDRLRELAR
jgi:tetratricopeptide (TPR) repeat protein